MDQSVLKIKRAEIIAAGKDAVDPMLNFGQFIFTDTQRSLEYLDSKLFGCLGFSAALLGLLGVGEAWPNGSLASGLAQFSGLACLAAIACSVYGLRARATKAPGAKIWLDESLFKDFVALKKKYVIALFESRETNVSLMEPKSLALRNSEGLLTIAGLLAFLALVVKIKSAS